MKQHLTYERRRIVRKHREEGKGAASAEAAAEIGSRVFPLPTPAAAMLTVARKSSTRVFVPRKAIAEKQRPGKGNFSARVLRSGKYLYPSEPVEKAGGYESGESDDVRWLERNGKGASRVAPESGGNEMAAPELQGLGKMFENVYSRKRQRVPEIGWIGLDSSSSNWGAEDRDPRFRVVFSRKTKRKKPGVMNGVGKVRGDQFGETEDFFGAGERCDRLPIREFDRNFLDTIDISESEHWTSFSEPRVLVVLLEFSCVDILLRFRRFLISVICWMRKGRMSLHNFTAFLLSEPMSGVFPRHGIHFLPLADRNSKFVLGSSFFNFGIWKIYNSRESLPLISLNFHALPSYFMSLHLAALLGSQYLPLALSTYLTGFNRKLIQDTQCDDCVSHVPMDTDFSGTSPSVSASPAVNGNAPSAVETSAVVAQSTVIGRRSKLRKLQRRRSFLRQSRTQKISSMDGTLCSSENGARSLVDPLHVRHLETFDEPVISSVDKVISTSPGSHSKLMEVGKKSHSEQMKEIKAALSDIKQNINSVQCNASILVTAGDRCWREEGAEVWLELSSSGEWCLAVKVGSNLRYLHRPQDMKYTLNRFNHAYMWIGEDGWRLEFSEKWDWLTFKELHAECRQRNNHPKEDASVKVIPVPVFKDVPAYEDDSVSSFELPEQYIHMKHDDEILRATVSEVPYYDMDSGDEEWLKQHNSSSSIIQNDGTSSYLLEDTFERMIFKFEKNAYYSSSNAISFEREPNNHDELGSKDMVADVYDYWLKKRKQKHAPLVRVFQGLSLRKPQLMQRQVLRKRRSLKRLRSQVGRGKPAFGFDSKAKEEAEAEALLKVQEAENAWRLSTEVAVPLRRRAQLLMENADLAAYKSFMALRISEAIGSMPTEVVSSILDSLPEI